MAKIEGEQGKTFICCDMKSFYASVECVARGLDPLKARLLVADESRSDKTICLAVSPALKAIGVPSRPRLFEAKEAIRLYEAANHTKVDYIIAPPRMAEYIRVSSRIYPWFRQQIRTGVAARRLSPAGSRTGRLYRRTGSPGSISKLPVQNPLHVISLFRHATAHAAFIQGRWNHGISDGRGQKVYHT